MAMKLQISTIKKFLNKNHTCLAIITLDSVLKEDENYYSQVLLKECKYVEKILVSHILDNLGSFSYSSDEYDEE